MGVISNNAERPLSAIKAVVFDAYGTLLHVENPTLPYQKLLQLCFSERPWSPGRLTFNEHYRRTIMTLNKPLLEMAQSLHPKISDAELEHLQQLLATELMSILFFDDALPTLLALQESGIKIGICSNLAKPYAEPLFGQVPPVDVLGLSYRLNCMKPDPAIYQYMIDGLELSPEEILFVGDTLGEDYESPIYAGMAALHLRRNGPCDGVAEIQSLAEILPRLGI
jgi:HAD superfamily hydrolase (TIGR01549 family)